MSEPIDFTVVKRLQTALRAIAVASSYHYDVEDVAVKLDPNCDVESLVTTAGLRPYVLIQINPDTWQYFPASQVRYVIPAAVHFVTDALPNDDLDRVKTFFQAGADVERAIVDGGLEGYVTIVKRALDEEAKNGVRVWTVIDIEFVINRTFGQPDA